MLSLPEHLPRQANGKAWKIPNQVWNGLMNVKLRAVMLSLPEHLPRIIKIKKIFSLKKFKK